MLPLPKLTSLLVLALSGFTSSSSAALVAAWDFNTGTSADLTSNVGSYTFERSVAGNDPVYSPGSISLDQFTGLFATGINSSSLPTLAQTSTIYLRLKLDSAAATDAGFYFGLLNATTSADWAQMTLTGWTYNGVNTGGYFATTADLGGEATSVFPAVGEYYSIALTASAGTDQFGNPDPTQTRIQTYFNGSLANTMVLTGGSLNAFESFALGQLKASGGVAGLTFDTVQIYDTVLTAAEIAAIPEPSTVALMLGGAALILYTSSRRKFCCLRHS